jgi:hypothetical protein
VLLVCEQGGRPSRLEIKKDAKGMVVVPGATAVEVTSARELMTTIEAGQQRRHVSSTQARAAPRVSRQPSAARARLGSAQNMLGRVRGCPELVAPSLGSVPSRVWVCFQTGAGGRVRVHCLVEVRHY